jgi:hypothetical protein
MGCAGRICIYIRPIRPGLLPGFSRTSGFQSQISSNLYINIWTESNKLSDAEIEHLLFHVPSEPWPTWRPTTILGMCCMRFTRHWIRPAQTLEKSWDNIAWRDNTEEISHSPFIWWLKYKKVEGVTVDHLNPNTFANLHFPPSMATILRFQPGANHASRPNALKLRVFLPCSSPNWSKLRFWGEKQRTQDGNEGRR